MAAAESIPHPNCDVETIPGRVARLRATFDSGRTRSLEWRREQLQGMQQLVADHGDDFAKALHADFRKPALEALTADVGQAKGEAALALKNLEKWTRPEKMRGMGSMPGAGRARVVRDPLGVVLIIAPWNYPVGLLLSPAVGAIAAGNAIVLKPSEVTPHTSALLAEVVPSYLDPEAITLVEGGVDETTALLEERFDHIFYTGNGHVGRIVMKAAAEHLTPVTLELGGKSPCLVNEDADIAVAARRIAWGKFLNSGQTCIAPDYVLVHRSKEAELVSALRKTVEEFYGKDPKSTPDYARVVNERHHARLDALLKDGKVAFGGESDAEDCYIAPTVLQDVSADSAVMQDEIFGPILPVLPVDSMQQAIDFVSEREKPLALYLFTSDEATEEAVLEETSSGGVCVNGTILHIGDARMPFGGVGPSGMGAYHGKHTFETFSHRKAVLTRGVRFDPQDAVPALQRADARAAAALPLVGGRRPSLLRACLASLFLVAFYAGSASPAAAEDPARFVVVTHGQASDPFWSVVKRGIDQARDDLGVRVEYAAPPTFDVIRMARLVEAAAASRPAGLAVSIPDADALRDAIDAAVGAGVPVVSLNSGADVSRGLGALLHVGQTEHEAGLRAGRRLAEAGVMRAVCLNHEVGNVALDRRCQGFREGLGGEVALLATSFDPTEIGRALSAHLSKHPSTQAVLTLSPAPAEAALSALEEEGLLGSVRLATFDISPAILDALVEDKLVFAIDQQPFLQGYLAVSTLVLKHRYGLLPASDVLTGPGFVTSRDAARVIELSKQGIR